MGLLDLFRKPKPNKIHRQRFRRERDVDRYIESHSHKAKRRFDVAETDESNRARWCGSDSRSINQLLFSQLKTLHERCSYEARNNPIVDSTIDTHAKDVVGPNGPKIQVDGASDSWNTEAEAIIAEWAQSCTADGASDLGEWMRQDIRDIWVTGDMLSQIVSDPYQTGIRTRIHQLDGRGLYMWKNDATTFMGVERNEYRRPVAYWLVDPEVSLFNMGYSYLNAVRVPSRDILHSFMAKERLQVRGYPILTPSLDVVSQLREYDNSVIRAANTAAMMSVLIHNTSEAATVEADEDPDTMQLNQGGLTKVPWGWAATGLNSTQPMPQNTEFRTDRIRELGYPVAMPLIHLRHDASNSNYSSARYDAGAYEQTNKTWQSWMFRKRVRPVLYLVLQEAMLIGRLPIRNLRNIRIAAIFTNVTPIDPVKSAMAAKLRLESKTSSPMAEARLEGNDFEQICKDWARANKILQQNGLPPMLGEIPSTPESLVAWLQAVKLTEDPSQPERISEATVS